MTLLRSHIEGNCSWGPLLAGGDLVLDEEYSSDSVF